VDAHDEAREYALRVLTEASAAMHYRDVCDRAQALGWHCEAQHPDRFMYRAVRADIRELGVNSVFRQPADATLDLASRHETATPLSEVKRTERPEREGAVRPTKQTLSLVCGHCTYLEFNGCHEVDQTSGVCNIWQQSARLGVQAREPGCIYWKQRTAHQRVMDRNQRLTCIAAITGENTKRKKK
jgi:hypothetical protein